MAKGQLEFILSEDETAVGYLSMPAHPGKGTCGVVVKQIRLLDVVNDYKGPDVYLDFDAESRLIGIEIVG